MTLRFLPSFALSLALALGVACSSKSSSSTPPPSDAAPMDAVTQDTSSGPPEEASAPPMDTGLAPQPDAPDTPCDMLLGTVTSLQPSVQACNPNSGMPQCKVAVEGTCCPISIDESTSQDTVNAFETAVTEYVTKCSPKCTLPTCPPTPSGLCSETLSVCQ